MASTFETILTAIAGELPQFGFKTVVKGWVSDRAGALPLCQVVPRAKDREDYSQFADLAKYKVEIVMKFTGQDPSLLVSETLEKAEQIQAHFRHKVFSSVSGHIDTFARISSLPVQSGGGNPGRAAPTVEVILEVIEEYTTGLE